MKIPLRWKRTSRHQNRQAGAGALVAATVPTGSRPARAGLAHRLGNALMLRAFYRAASAPAVAAGLALAAGVLIGAALVLGTFAQLAAREAVA